MKRIVMGFALFCSSLAIANPKDSRIVGIMYRCRIAQESVIKSDTYKSNMQKAITNEEWNSVVTEAIYAVREKCKKIGVTEASLLAVDGISVGTSGGIFIHTIM